MLCELTSQNISLRDHSTRGPFTGNSTVEKQEINEKLDIQLYFLMQQSRIKPQCAPLNPSLFEIDFSSISPHIETKSETFLSEKVAEEVAYEEMIEHDIVVRMHPKGRHSMKIRGFREKKAEPRIVLPEWL